jgi:predicted nucleic acid-binding protein
MNVYVESNFVIELALEQEEADSCSEIVDLAIVAKLELLVPAFSLAEPYQAIAGKEKVRARLGEELRSHLGELGRSRPHRAMPSTFGPLSDALIERAQFERDGLRRTISELIQVATVMALDSKTLIKAASLENEYGLSGQDSIVLATVLAHLEATRPDASCFLTRNSKDFDDPDIREGLDAYNCKFFARFASAAAFLKAHRG